jgi:dehydrogenase/reductase SDR family protein 12
MYRRVLLHCLLILPLLNRTGYLRHIQEYQDPVQKAAAIPSGHADADNTDLRQKVVVVTGANSGLGKEIATYAAAKGAKVYMLCRSQERAAAAKKDMIQQIETYDSSSSSSLQDRLNIVLVDVAELQQVREAVQQLQKQETKVDALVCNAGVLLNERNDTSEGNEATFASHLLGGSYLLSQLLLPQLKAAQGRCIFVTSGGMYNFKLPSWKVLTSAPGEKYNGVNVYAYAKRAQVLLAERLTETEPAVQWVTAHPGWSDTPAVDEAFGDMKKYLHPLREPWQGAEGVAWLVGTKREKIQSGEFYLDRKTQPKHMAGPFFTEGRYTKNSKSDVDDLMENLKKAAGL